MGMLEVIVLATMDFGVRRWAKPSPLQYIVHEAGISVGDICSWLCQKYS